MTRFHEHNVVKTEIHRALSFTLLGEVQHRNGVHRLLPKLTTQNLFQSKMLWKIFGTVREKWTEDWRYTHNEKVHEFNTLPTIVKKFKSNKMNLSRHVAWMNSRRGIYSYFEMIILKQITEKENLLVNWIHLTQNSSFCGNCDEPSKVQHETRLWLWEVDSTISVQNRRADCINVLNLRALLPEIN